MNVNNWQVVIDGPLIGVSYNREYELNDHINCLGSYTRQVESVKKIRYGFRTMKPYPIQALVKLLFYFIARGHKATAFLPIFFDEGLDRSCHNQCSLVSNMEQFRELVRLKLIKFLSNETFANQIKRYTADCNGILVTSPNPNGHPEENTTFASGTNSSYNLVNNTMIPGMLFDNNKLPLIIPLFRPYNHKLIISLDVVRWQKILEVEKREVSIPQYELLINEQLTLQTQFGLLSKLVSMLDDQFPCGPSDADIIPLFRHELGLPD